MTENSKRIKEYLEVENSKKIDLEGGDLGHHKTQTNIYPMTTIVGY